MPGTMALLRDSSMSRPIGSETDWLALLGWIVIVLLPAGAFLWLRARRRKKDKR